MATKAGTLEIPASEVARYKSAIHECMTEIDEKLKRMRRTQHRIDRLRAQTHKRLDEIKSALR